MSQVGEKNVKYGTTVERTEVANDLGKNADVHYMSSASLKADVLAQAKTLMLSDQEIQKKLKELPLNGSLIVNIAAPIIESGDTRHWSVVITDESNQVLQRYQPRASVANYTLVNGATFWHNSFTVPVLFKAQGNFNVYVVDAIKNQRWGFKIYNNSSQY